MTNHFFFECPVCGHKVEVETTQPSGSGGALCCDGCGHEFGGIGALCKALATADTAAVDSALSEVLSQAAVWD